MTPIDQGWPVRILRPLPRTVAPVADETLQSYLWRLARANRLDDTALRKHLTGKISKFATISSGTLALVSGQPEHVLRWALPELAQPGDPQLPGRVPPGTGGRLACSWCALVRRHHADVAWCWNDHDHVVCHRHRRWIGDGNDQPDSGQPDLTDQPDILQANRRHHRLVRRVGRYRATIAYQQARTICSRWHRNDDHDDDFQRLMLRFHGPHWQVSRSHPTLFAARYPQIVALTTLLASAYWQSAAQRQWPEPTKFINQVRRDIAPHYRWTLRPHHGIRDPLTELIAEQRGLGRTGFHQANHHGHPPRTQTAPTDTS